MKIIYHASCADGFCCAYLLHKKYPQAEFIPMHYSTFLHYENFSLDEEVILADFSFKRDILETLARKVKHIAIYDHHKTAQKDLSSDLPDNVSCIFDMAKAGCEIVWDVLYPGEEQSKLVQYVADRDLWKFNLTGSKAVSMYIKTISFEFDRWANLDIKMRNDIDDVIYVGRKLIEYQNIQIKSAVRSSYRSQLNVPNMGVYVIPSVNVTNNISEVCGDLARNEPFSIGWFVRKDGIYQYSLRSDEAGIDVSEIAKQFGGGGHKHAAGFSQKDLVLNKVDDV